MKVIDLLNKIANGEEVPKKFKFEDDVYYLSSKNCYRSDITDRIFEEHFVLEDLNDEVEIIEDKPFNKRVEEIYNRHIDYIYDKEDKEIEKIPKKDKNGDIYLYSNEALEIIDKINEIIDKINKGE